MQTILYIIWILVPLIFFLLALWSRLEQGTKGKQASKEPADLLRQAFFVSGCSLVTFLIDYLFSESVSELLPSFIPIEFVQLMILPVVLYIAALTVGGSKPIRIKKAPRPSQYKRDK